MKGLTLYDRGTTLLIIGGGLMLCLIVGGYFLMSEQEQSDHKGVKLESFGTVPENVVFVQRQNGQDMNLGKLRGAPWVASFIFTSVVVSALL